MPHPEGVLSFHASPPPFSAVLPRCFFARGVQRAMRQKVPAAAREQARRAASYWQDDVAPPGTCHEMPCASATCPL